jgi:hypothetical protein
MPHAKAQLAQFGIKIDDEVPDDATLDFYIGAGLGTEKMAAEARAKAEEVRKDEMHGPQLLKTKSDADVAQINAASVVQTGLTPAQIAEFGKGTQHPVSVNMNGKPAAGVQVIQKDGTSKVFVGNKEVQNAEIYHQPNMMTDPETKAARQRLAKRIAAGNLSSIREVSSMRGEGRTLLVDMIQQENPDFNTSELNRKIKMMDWLDNGKGADQIQSYGTFLEHAGNLADVLNASELSGTPAWNMPINWIRKNISGDPRYSALITAIEAPKKEFESFLLNNRALYESDRTDANKMLSENLSPAMIMSALKAMGNIAKGRTNEINQRVKRVIGQDVPFDELYSPDAQDAARKIGIDIGGGQQQTSGNNLSNVSTDELFNMLSGKK